MVPYTLILQMRLDKNGFDGGKCRTLWEQISWTAMAKQYRRAVLNASKQNAHIIVLCPDSQTGR